MVCCGCELWSATSSLIILRMSPELAKVYLEQTELTGQSLERHSPAYQVHNSPWISAGVTVRLD